MTIGEKCGQFFDAITRRKTIDSSSSDTNLKRCLGVIDLTAIGISSTLGAGLYVLAGDVARYTAGPGVVLSFLIAAIASILSALCYTEFASKIPKAGTAYVYSYVMIGELTAFVIGWNLILEFVIGEASVARAFSAYLESLTGIPLKNHTATLIGEVHVYGFSTRVDALALLLCIVISIFLSFGIQYSAKLNSLLTCLNLAILAVVIGTGLFYIDTKNWSNFTPYGVTGIIDGASTCFYAYIGFDVIATTAEEAKNPAKAIPISILGTIVICFVSYFGVSAILTLMVPYYTLAGDSALVSAFQTSGAVYAKYVIGVGAGLSLFGTTVISLVPLPRLFYAMSSDGLLPKVFGKVNERSGTPVFSTIFSGIFSGIMAFILDLHDLVEMMSIGTLLAYSIVTVCVLVLRYDKIELKGSSTPSQFEVAKKNITESDKKAIFAFDGVLEEEEAYEILREGADETKRSQTAFAKVLILIIVILLIGITWILAYHQSSITKIWVLVTIGVLTLGLIISTIVLGLQKQTNQEMPFKVPFVPVIPVISLFINVYLVFRLQWMTWARLVVWLAIGLVVYFVHGIRKSIHRKDFLPDADSTRYIPLKNIDEERKPVERPSGLYPSLAELSKQ